MKKILLLISVLVISSGCQKAPTEGVKYEIRNDPIWNGNAFISLGLSYQLPVHRTKDFLGTLLLYFTNPELRSYHFFEIIYEESNTIFDIYFGDNAQITVSDNVNYNGSVTDPKDDNYYTTIVTIADSLPVIEDTTQLHLRQDLEPTTTISLMIKAKPYKVTDYEYVGHTVLNEIVVTEGALGYARPLPDILK